MQTIKPTNTRFVPELGQNIHLALPKKKQAGFEMVGGPPKLTYGWVEDDFGSDGPLTLPQLCQNYMSLCVRIGKIDRLARPLNA
jgi:hypothetical protein